MAELNEKAITELTKLARMSVTVQMPGPGGLPFAVIPNDCKLQDLSALVHHERPQRIKGTVRVSDALSFCDYYTLFSDPNSRVFADEGGARIVAVLDYHAAGEGNAPRWCEHRVDLTLAVSREWGVWIGKSGARLSQQDFAEFLEDNTPDIIKPDAAVMLDVAKTLTAKIDVDFASAIRLNNGAVQFKYTEQVKATYGSGTVEVPESFVISVPVYRGSDPVQITARLRYRIASGKLTFWYDLLRADAAMRDAFGLVRKNVSEQLSCTVIGGIPA